MMTYGGEDLAWRYAFTRCIRLVLPLPAMPMTIATVGLDAEGDAPEEGAAASQGSHVAAEGSAAARTAGGDAIEALREGGAREEGPSERARKPRGEGASESDEGPVAQDEIARIASANDDAECARDEQVMRRFSTRRVVQLVLW